MKDRGMDRHIDVKQALRVYSELATRGKKVGDEYHLNGLRGTSDWDGYTVSLFDDYCRLDIFFHNRFSIKHTNAAALTQFIEKLHSIDQAANRRVDAATDK